jgi:hypothetical protein
MFRIVEPDNPTYGFCPQITQIHRQTTKLVETQWRKLYLATPTFTFLNLRNLWTDQRPSAQTTEGCLITEQRHVFFLDDFEMIELMPDDGEAHRQN